MACCFELEHESRGSKGCQFGNLPDEISKILGDLNREYKFSGQTWCVFHLSLNAQQHIGKSVGLGSPDQIQNFNSAVHALIERAREQAETCDLSGVVFPGDVDFRGMKFPDVLFIASVFCEDARFEGSKFLGGSACFDSAQFSGETVSFDRAEFHGHDVRFRNARFSGGDTLFSDVIFIGGDAQFRGAEFSGRSVSFHRAKFSGGIANFTEAKFHSRYVEFGDAEFSGDAWFKSAQFSSNAAFKNSTFRGDAWFKQARFESSATFMNVRFGSFAHFEHAVFRSDALFISARFNLSAFFLDAEFAGHANFHLVRFDLGANFSSRGDVSEAVRARENHFPALDLKDAIFGHDAIFTNRQFILPPDLRVKKFAKAPDFNGCDIHEGTLFPGRETFEDVSGDWAALSYTKLKNTMAGFRRTDDEAMFYALELESKLNGEKTPESVKRAIRLYEWTADYGQSFARPVTRLSQLVGFAFVAYFFLDQIVTNGADAGSSIRLAITLSLEQIFRPFAIWGAHGEAMLAAYGWGWQLLVKLVAAFQSAASIGLIALALFALRWRFKRP